MTAGFRRQDVQFRSVSFFNVNATPSASPPGATVGSSSMVQSLNGNVVLAMAVLLVVLVVGAFINTVARCFLRRRRQWRPEEHNGTDKGLDKSVIEALPVAAYGAESLKSLFDSGGDNECVVCLNEFVLGETLRMLPECQHGFHVVCINAWLITHKTCPVCRRNVLPAESEAGPSCARTVAGGSDRFGSSRFGSARIASVDVVEIETSGQSASENTAAGPAAAAASSSTRSFLSTLLTEARASIVHGAPGPRRLALQNQGRV